MRLFLILLAVGVGFLDLQAAQRPSLEARSQPMPALAANKINVVTSFYPLYVATLNVVGTPNLGHVHVANMAVRTTGCLHDYQLTPRDMRTLSGADVLVVNGAGMEDFLDKVTRQLPKLKIINASQKLVLLKTHGCEDDDHHHHHHHHQTDEDEVDSHTWMSVSNMMIEVKFIADELAKIDRPNAKIYRDNAQIYIQKLEKLREHMVQETKALRRRKMVNFHNAFAYFAKEFKLEVLTTVELEPGAQPRARELAQVVKVLRSHPDAALFIEPGSSRASIDVIGRETGKKVYELDPLTSGPRSAPAVFDAYLQGMEKNLQTIKEALN